MNQLITYDDAAGVLRMPAFPKMSRPDFTSVRALRKHFHRALAKLECPQSLVYGWTGVAMDPVMYSLIELTQFTIHNPRQSRRNADVQSWVPTPTTDEDNGTAVGK